MDFTFLEGNPANNFEKTKILIKLLEIFEKENHNVQVLLGPSGCGKTKTGNFKIKFIMF